MRSWLSTEWKSLKVDSPKLSIIFLLLVYQIVVLFLLYITVIIIIASIINGVELRV